MVDAIILRGISDETITAIIGTTKEQLYEEPKTEKKYKKRKRKNPTKQTNKKRRYNWRSNEWTKSEDKVLKKYYGKKRKIKFFKQKIISSLILFFITNIAFV